MIRLHNRMKQNESNAAGMSIMIQYLLEEAGVKQEDWLEIMKASIAKDYGLSDEEM